MNIERIIFALSFIVTLFSAVIIFLVFVKLNTFVVETDPLYFPTATPEPTPELVATDSAVFSPTLETAVDKVDPDPLE